LAVKSADFISFYDWETQIAVRRIDVTPAPKQVYWSDDGKTVVMALEEQFYLLNYDAEQVKEYINQKDPHQEQQEEDEDDEGCEEAFDMVDEFSEIITSGLWVSNECFVYTNIKGHIYYMVG